MSTFNLDINGKKFKDTKDLNKKLLKVCKDIYKNKNNVQFSNEGYQSPRLDLKKYPVFLELYKKVKIEVLQNLEVFDLFEKKLDVSLPWINVNKPGDFNWPHKHLDSHFSLVYYLKAPKKSGDIVFKNPFTENNNFYLKGFHSYNSNNSNVYRHTPEESFLIMFPSNIEHAVERNESKQDRISIAFDVNIK
jgi:uncharacterized protein (TIGR02466 family)